MSTFSESIQLTRDEYRNITRCLGDENFRKLFAEYCNELSDPENRIQYEKEITLLESERGFDVKFIKPLPGYVIKTTTKEDNKIFINVCHSDLIGKPQSKAKRDAIGLKGLDWSIPYAQVHPRKDYDNKKNACMVYDVVFHYDTLHLAKQNANFRKLVTDTAVDAVECSFNISLNKNNLKFPKLQYKGVPKMSIIRQRTKISSNRTFAEEESDNNYNNGVLCHTKNNDYITPIYKLIHKKCIDYFEMATERINSNLKPDEIVIEIQLPLLNSANDCLLNVVRNELHLISQEPAKYKLQVKLPFEVSEKNGAAKFNADEKILLISLPVIKTKQIGQFDSNIADNSNIEMLEQNVETTIKQESSIFSEKPETEDRKRKFPKFSTNKMENIFAFTINVRNVDPESIKVHKGVNTVKYEFSNIGSGFFPCYYVFFARFPDASICDIEYEEWKNCLILKVILDNSQIDCYYVGLDEDNLTKHAIVECITDPENKFDKEIEDDSLCIEVSKSIAKREQKLSNMSIEIKTKNYSNSECIVKNENKERENKTDKSTKWLENTYNDVITSKPEASGTELNVVEDNNENSQDLKKHKRHPRRRHKKRSLSESSCDHLKVILENETAKMEPEQMQSVGEEENVYLEKQIRKGRSVSESCATEPEIKNETDNNTVANQNLKTLIQFNGKCKGILKYASIERSISECSDDNYLASSMDSSTVTYSLDQSNSYLSDSCRKTVRFNEFIKTKLFRSNTSILAQKKKNAKKNESKRRALSRRLSEGESTDNDDKDVVGPNPPDVEVQQYQEHDSGISLHSDSELTACNELDNKRFANHGTRKNVEILQSNPIDIVANVGNVSSKSKDNASKKTKASRCNASEHQQPKGSKGMQFKSEMIFDIEV